MAYSIPDIITWSKISQVLAFYDCEKKKYTAGGFIDDDLHIKLKIERSVLEWEYAQDPTSDNLFVLGNYVYALCGQYIFQAMTTSGGGGVVVPGGGGGSGILFPLYIKSTNFSTATLYPNTNLFGNSIIVFLNEINRFLIPSDEFTVDAAGLHITLDGFDALVNDYHLVIEKYNN